MDPELTFEVEIYDCDGEHVEDHGGFPSKELAEKWAEDNVFPPAWWQVVKRFY